MKTRTSRWAMLFAVVLALGVGATSRSEPANGQTPGPALAKALRSRTIFTGAEMPMTERGAVARGGRFFVSSGNNLFEVVRDGHGGFDKISIAQASVTLASGQVVPGQFEGVKARGDVLYAIATAFSPPPAPGSLPVPLASTLYRIALGKRHGIGPTTTAPFTGHAGPFLPNGMALDRAGHIFVANSFSATTGEAAISKITVTGADPLTFTETPWLPTAQGGAFPNGLQIRGDDVFLSSLNVLLRIETDKRGAAGTPALIYQADPNNFLDDFAVLPGLIAVAEIDSPLSPPTTDVSQITFVSTLPGRVGKVRDVFSFAGTGVFPSSVTVSRGGTFRAGALLVTDFLAGGLYELTTH